MNIFSRFGNRFVQGLLRLAMPFLRIPMPIVLHSVAEVASVLKEKEMKRPMLVTDEGIVKAGLVKIVESSLASDDITLTLYDGAVPNPTFACVEQGYQLYVQNDCNCLIALGGGSSMDAAKGIAIKVAYPNKNLAKFKGILKIHRKTPLSIAIPTTAGTGSECTIAAVLVNEETHDKFQIDSPRLVPHYALLDPIFVKGLPPRLIATTGMDALTHAIEAYIGRSNTRFTLTQAEYAVRSIANNLLRFYASPNNEEAAGAMQLAAYQAGAAFTRAYVGYVHALSHALGGFYNAPHGYCNAVLLPHVLRAYGDSVKKPLAKLAPLFGCAGSSEEELTEAVIEKIEGYNAMLGIPKTFGHKVSRDDYHELAIHAAKEANPLYPVPKLLTVKELEMILRKADQEETK